MFFQLVVLPVISQLYGSMQIAGSVRVVSQLLTHICPFFLMRTCITRVPNMINYVFSMHVRLSNGKRVSMQQETRPYVSDFPFH
jgi:hypothetical protein